MAPVLASLLLLVAADPSAPRKAYSACLVQFVQTSAQKKITAEQFDAELATACTSEEQSFRRSVVSSDVSRGISRKTSEQGVSDEIADYRSTTKDRYRSTISASN